MGIVDLTFLWAAFMGLFAIINPFSTGLVFLGLTSNDSEQRKKFLAKKASILCMIIMFLFMISGSLIFKIFSISIEAFQIAGGLLVAKVGFDMLNPKLKSEQSEDEHKESKQKKDISLIPLAIPMLSGPGAITTGIVWMSQATGMWNKIGLLVIILIISAIAYIVLRNAKYLKKVLGTTGTNVIERLMGLIVLVMGIQFIINALRTLIPVLLG
ncbi:MAG: MarC family protein [Nanoarchaeota archaeon]|nr:MarC family protein [Nanoarchaeota archaeon]MBU1320788.1 MarC family protein [Nanoarchaeota archaeon]MBU1598293.1 MarC family protein [Nanoarchaeota archaeon]MBU2442257.1 MarC family protein [Nanoarchaeota archaeon]